MEIGEINRNNQKLIAKTELPGTDFGSKIDILACTECGYIFAATQQTRGSAGARNIKTARPVRGIPKHTNCNVGRAFLTVPNKST